MITDRCPPRQSPRTQRCAHFSTAHRLVVCVLLSLCTVPALDCPSIGPNLLPPSSAPDPPSPLPLLPSRSPRTVMSDLSFSCSLCTRSFGSSNALTQHRRSSHLPTIPCGVCGRVFVSAHAVEQHTAASHPPLFECPTCNKSFRNEAGRDEHSRVVHPASFACAHCNKNFASEGGRDMHQRAVHKARAASATAASSTQRNRRHRGAGAGRSDDGNQHEEGDDDQPNLRPPVDSPGYWVRCEEFTGRKSFGYFQCGCGKGWMSAHAFPDFMQGCQTCEAESLPTWLWVNISKDVRPREDKIDDKPHDRARCEACKAGQCVDSTE